MDIPNQPPRYRAYLLTKWEERGQDAITSVVWRFGLEDIQNSRRYVFATIDQLIAQLRKEMIGGDTNEES